MKTLSKTSAQSLLNNVRVKFRSVISTKYETRAKNCGDCDVRGSCCTDEHFVNVRITRLEAEAISLAIDELPEDSRSSVLRRTEEEIRRMRDREGFFSCPLFDPEQGCLVHKTAKPLPCIHHACYERGEDLPPDSLLEEAELEVVRLNSRRYGNAWSLEPIPLAIARDGES